MKRRKKRRVNKLVIFLTLAYFITVFAMYSVGQADTPVEYVEVFVDYNDTLWTIASENCTECTDVRQYIKEIRELNNMDSSTLYANTVIKLPVQ